MIWKKFKIVSKIKRKKSKAVQFKEKSREIFFNLAVLYIGS